MRNRSRKPLRTPNDHPETEATAVRPGLVQEGQSERMNWENERTKCGPEASHLGNEWGPFAWKGSRFGRTLPDNPTGHSMPDLGSQISPDWTKQTAGSQTDRFQAFDLG